MSVQIAMSYMEPASPWLRRTFTVQTTTEWFTAQGSQRGAPAVSEQRYLADEFPFDLAWRLVNGRRMRLELAY